MEAHLEHGVKVPTFESGPFLFPLFLFPINGACHRVTSDETAFARRDTTFAVVISGTWPDPADNEKNTRWVRDYYDALRPYSEEGGYVNFMSADDQGCVRSNYGSNYDRLKEIKAKFDPENLFSRNQNIPSAG